jgi:ATP-binding cassette subfamily F protein 3
VANGKAEPFESDLEGYSQWLNEQRLKDKQLAQIMVEEKPSKNERALNKAERQARIAERRPLVKEVEQLELNIAKWQVDKKLCDDRLNDSELYISTDKTELQQLLKTQADLTSQIDVAEERWLVLHELLEALPAID